MKILWVIIGAVYRNRNQELRVKAADATLPSGSFHTTVKNYVDVSSCLEIFKNPRIAIDSMSFPCIIGR